MSCRNGAAAYEEDKHIGPVVEPGYTMERRHDKHWDPRPVSSSSIVMVVV